MQTLSSKKIEQTRDVLSQLAPGALPFELFIEVCRLTVTPVIEVACFRRNHDGTIGVALLQRSDSDANWPGMYHIPGAVITPLDLDQGLAALISRICAEKLGVHCENSIFIMNDLCRVQRGVELGLIYMAEIEGEIANGQFYDVSKLPDNFIEGHGNFISQALLQYQKL